MKKKVLVKVMVISIFVLLIAIPTFVLAAPKVPATKGTVTGRGSYNYPYVLILGEPLIDVKYLENEKDMQIWFEFEPGPMNGNAANYIVEHIADQKLIRFKLQGSDTKAASQAGARYVQAGAKNYIELFSINNAEGASQGATFSGEVQNPYYEIRSIEEIPTNRGTYTREISLGNGFLMVDNVYAGNVSTYSTAYIFAQKELSGTEAYQGITDYQISKKLRIGLKPIDNSYYGTRNAYFLSPTQLQTISYDEDGNEIDGEILEINGKVKVKYCFRGPSSAIHGAEGQEDGWLAKVLAKILTSIGDVFTTIGLSALDKSTPSEASRSVLTIDALVFNEYPFTYVGFFDNDSNANTMNGMAKKVIKKWYDIFRTWAFVVYVIILVYIGIRAVVYAGTKDQKKLWSLLEGWVMGILLMYICPIFFKYGLLLNDALVDIMRVNSKHSIYAYYSFMDLDGYEEGQDSESTIVDILIGNLTQIYKEITKLENLRDSYSEDLDAAQKRLEAITENPQAEMAKGQKSLERVLASNPNAKISIGSTQLSNDDVVDNLWKLVNKFYNENKDMIDWSDTASAWGVEDGTFLFGDTFNDALYEAVEDRINGYTIYGMSDGDANYFRKQLVEAVMGSNPTPYATDGTIYNGTGAQFDHYERETMYLFLGTQAEAQLAQYEIDDLNEQINNLENTASNYSNALNLIHNGEADMMGEMRNRASKYKFWDSLVWYILLFELIILLVLYYKRFFVIACLIIIFPLVMIAYVYEKTTKPESSILKNWTQEYIINVFIQTVHAIIYVTLVETSYTVYQDVGDNWLLFILAVLALITSEGVVKHLLDLQGNTVKDLAKYSAEAGRRAAATVAVAKTALGTMKDLENIDNAYKNQLANDQKKNEKSDKRKDIWRTHQDNKIRGNSNLSESEKKQRLEELRRKREEKDKKTAKKRAKKAQQRRRAAYAKGVGRVVANATGVVATVAAGFAAGGDPEDFIKASAATKAVLGKGETVSLTGDAQQMIDKAKVNSEASIDSVKQEAATDGQPQMTDPGRYQGSGGDYSYVPGSLGGGTVDDDQVESGARPRLADAFGQRLTEEQVHTERTRQQTTHYREEIHEQDDF